MFVAHGFGRIEPLKAATDDQLLDKFKRWGIPTGPYRSVVQSIEEILERLPEWDQRRKKLPYATDGLVIKVDALDQRDAPMLAASDLGIAMGAAGWRRAAPMIRSL